MTLISTGFGFETRACDVVAGIDLQRRRAVVTGASSGLGIETARALMLAGAMVTLAVRDVAAGHRVAAEIAADTGRDVPHVSHLDLSDADSVSRFAAQWDGPLDILVNNAGVMATPERHVGDGLEWQFAVNHLGHFALATGLYPALAASGSARIVSVSSAAHQRSPVIFDDLHFRFRPYDPWQAYAQSKTAQILFAVEATRRWADAGITANALMPGAIYTNLQRHTGGKGSGSVSADLIKTPAQGAATSVLLATSPLLAGVGGRYFVDCNETTTLEARSTVPLHGVACYALDPDNAARLWDVSERLVTQR